MGILKQISSCSVYLIWIVISNYPTSSLLACEICKDRSSSSEIVFISEETFSTKTLMPYWNPFFVVKEGLIVGWLLLNYLRCNHKQIEIDKNFWCSQSYTTWGYKDIFTPNDIFLLGSIRKFFPQRYFCTWEYKDILPSGSIRIF